MSERITASTCSISPTRIPVDPWAWQESNLSTSDRWDYLTAIDPKTGKIAWRHKFYGGGGGGLLTTAGAGGGGVMAGGRA